jgi:hypothetical protein
MSFISPVLSYFRFLYVLPAFYILLAFGVSLFKKKLQYLLIFLLLIINLAGWTIYITDPGQLRENWKGAESYVEAKIKPDEAALFDYPDTITPFRWYADSRIKSYGGTYTVSANPTYTREKTSIIIKNLTGVYYFEYLRDISDSDRMVEKTLIEEGFKSQEVYNFNGVGQIYHYTK